MFSRVVYNPMSFLWLLVVGGGVLDSKKTIRKYIFDEKGKAMPIGAVVSQIKLPYKKISCSLVDRL